LTQLAPKSFIRLSPAFFFSQQRAKNKETKKVLVIISSAVKVKVSIRLFTSLCYKIYELLLSEFFSFGHSKSRERKKVSNFILRNVCYENKVFFHFWTLFYKSYLNIKTF